MTPLLRLASAVHLQLMEKGRMLSAANEKLMRAALDSITALLSKLPEPVEEAERSATDKQKILHRAVKQKLMAASPNADYVYCYIADLFDTYLVYETGGRYWSVPYVIDDAGVATLGDATEVIPRTVYEPADGAPALEESAITGDAVPLVEAQLTEASALMKLIAPGWGSSGYYSSAVLQDAAKVFKRGTKMYWNHPTEAEERARPEGDLSRLASELTEDAKYDASGPAGAGLYARAKVFDQYGAAVKDLAPHIGVSIRASGIAKPGEAEGRKGPIIEKIAAVRSVDYVTVPGAGGQVLQLFEAAGRVPPDPIPQVEEKMTEAEIKALVEAQVAPLREATATLKTDNAALKADNARLQEALAIRDGAAFVAECLRDITMPTITRDRLTRNLAESAIVMTDGKFDREKTKLAVVEAAKSELAYIGSLGGGVIRGMGAAAPPADDAAAITESRKTLADNLAALTGMKPEVAAAAAGRVA